MEHVQNDKVQFEPKEIVFARVAGTNLPFWPAKVDEVQNDLYVVELLSLPTHLKKYKSFECTSKQIISWTATKDNKEIEFDDILEIYTTENNMTNSTEIKESIWNAFWNAAKNGNKQHIHFAKCKHLQQKREKEQSERQQIVNKEKEIEKLYGGRMYDGRYLDNNGKIHGFELQAGDEIAYYPEGVTGNPYVQTKITHIGDLYVIQKRRSIGPISVETKYNPPIFDTEIHKVGIQDQYLFYELKHCKLIPSQVTDKLQEELQKARAKNDEAMEKKGYVVKVYDF
eukprot:67128_1